MMSQDAEGPMVYWIEEEARNEEVYTGIDYVFSGETRLVLWVRDHC